ncbi:twin-arginine translocation pathway signal [Bordetella genomosp. 9]|uniref:Twin-arginine translocation pathway signal n=1 Tax=Bordetella genomosp. 9 TaxID=1416803 RepID=A0A261R2Y6_9BORD|nr:tripartite tricarboxylate transporter substrate binding protein [Bordetella genomosp. 9]OZI18693.1 twin-arginine translocation pathway signal [Bordetella genomosp. 9]
MKLARPFLAAALLLVAGSATAQAAYPDKPVRIIVGFSPGGPTDVVARSFASYAGQALGQTFVVENRPGANTILAAEAVAKAPADGYTLLFGATNHTMIPALYSDRVKFDALRSFTPICAVAVSPTVLVVGPSMPVKTLDGFVARLKAEPGKHTFATPGTGSSGHFYTEQFLRLTGTSMNHIPYKGAAQAVSDLMGGQVDSSFATLGSVLPQVEAGKLTALAVAAPQRLPQLPDVPTFAQAGVKDYAAEAWYGVLAPAGIPADARQKLEQVAAAYASAAGTAKSLDALGMQPRSTCGDAFQSQMAHEIDEYSTLAKDLGLKAE